MKFTVVIPLYNKATYVEETLHSVMAQTLQPLEVLVVDDGSTDDGPARVLALQYAPLRLIRQRNAGVSAARNAGIEAARGDYVCFLDADDCYAPGFLAALAALARRHPEAGLIATGYVLRRATGALQPVRLHASVTCTGLVDDLYRAWCQSSFFCTISLAIRREVLADPALRFPVGEKLGEDQDLWFRVAEGHGVAYDPTPQALYRIDVQGSATAVGAVLDELPVYRRLHERLRAHRMPAALRPGAARLYASHLLNVARNRQAAGDPTGARALMWRPEARRNPLYWLRTVLLLTWQQRARPPVRSARP